MRGVVSACPWGLVVHHLHGWVGWPMVCVCVGGGGAGLGGVCRLWWGSRQGMPPRCTYNSAFLVPLPYPVDLGWMVQM